ncbi:hypothetical protein AAHZ94_20680 [Streptomyces sp. HSW2009]|uniref:hypothetical protein n=1 Tax=Streptomyces sp. HSW2009 TaxID=3142890 RepID=UPI0032EB0A46
MSEWSIALIAAGSALAGSLATGWFTRSAGARQAEAARHAGDRQADALLDTVRMTLLDQRAVRLLDLRRQTYVRFLEAAETSALVRRTGEREAGERAALQRAFGAVRLEGPDAVVDAAREVVGLVRREGSPDELDRARQRFIAECRTALDHSARRDEPTP